MDLLFNYIIIFSGITGIFFSRNNILFLLMHVELTLLGVNLNFLYFSIAYDDLFGQIFAFFILTVVAAETAIGLAIIIAYFKVHGTVLLSDASSLFRN